MTTSTDKTPPQENKPSVDPEAMAQEAKDEETFDTSKTFADLGLPEDVLKGITASGFVHPTKIQSSLIPAALTGRHVLGQAKTGTGKTAAFGLPMLSMIKPGDHFAALVLVPTRELAIQVAREIKDLGAGTPLTVLPVYGGQRITAQAPKLERGPEIVVGTPGRVMDLHDRRMLPYDTVRMAVLDEVDRMLDIGFRDDIRKILGGMRQRPQTIFVSATISGRNREACPLLHEGSDQDRQQGEEPHGRQGRAKLDQGRAVGQEAHASSPVDA